MARKHQKAVRAETLPEEPVEAVEPAETDGPVEADAEEASAQTETPSSPAVPSASARRAQALIDASKATGFPPPPAALKALNEETA